MTLGALATLAGVWFITIVVPGPDLVQIIRAGMRSKKAGVYCALGVAAGIAIWVVLSVAGLSALIAANPEVLVGLQIIGGCYLLYMGLSALKGVWDLRTKHGERGTRDVASTDASAAGGGVMDPGFADDAQGGKDEIPRVLGKWKAFRMGMLSDLSNPKTVVFFGAIFAKFLTPDMGLNWALIVGAVLIVEALVWVIFFALIVQVMSRWLMKYHAAVDFIAGLVLAGVGIWMLVEGVLALA